MEDVLIAVASGLCSGFAGAWLLDKVRRIRIKRRVMTAISTNVGSDLYQQWKQEHKDG